EAVDMADDGRIVAAGYFKDAMSLEGRDVEGIGRRDIFVATWDAEGVLQWVRPLGGDDWDDAETVRWDGQRVLVAGFAKGTLSTDEGPLTLNERSPFV